MYERAEVVQLDRQLHRMHALSRFAVEATTDLSAQRLCERAVTMLEGLFDFQRLEFVLVAPDGESPGALLAITRACCQGAGTFLQLDALIELAGLEAISPADQIMVIPARAENTAAYLLGWARAEEDEDELERPSAAHTAFFELVGQHLSQQLGRVALIEDLNEKRAALEHGSHAQLIGAGKLAALGQLASGVAHDFNNLLTVILTNAELAQEERPSDVLEEVIVAARQGASLVDQLLSFSRREDASAICLDVNAVIQNMSGILRTLVGDTVKLNLTLAPAIPPVRIEQSQLEQVLLNLVVNARDACGRRGRVIVQTEASAEWVRLSVLDQGPGLTPEQAERIFDYGYTTKPSGEGSGLGLSIVQRIVERHGGRVEVSSQPGAGSALLRGAAGRSAATLETAAVILRDARARSQLSRLGPARPFSDTPSHVEGSWPGQRSSKGLWFSGLVGAWAGQLRLYQPTAAQPFLGGGHCHR